MNSRTAHGAKTLPRAYYTSDAIFSRELDQIFSRRWLFAGHAARSPSLAISFSSRSARRA